MVRNYTDGKILIFQRLTFDVGRAHKIWVSAVLIRSMEGICCILCTDLGTVLKLVPFTTTLVKEQLCRIRLCPQITFSPQFTVILPCVMPQGVTQDCFSRVPHRLIPIQRGAHVIRSISEPE